MVRTYIKKTVRGHYGNKNLEDALKAINDGTPLVRASNPVSTGILPHSLPEWAFWARPGLWRNCLCPKVARIAEQKFALPTVKAKLGQTSSFPNGPQIWFPIGQ